jgi:hypothetical protein
MLGSLGGVEAQRNSKERESPQVGEKNGNCLETPSTALDEGSPEGLDPRDWFYWIREHGPYPSYVSSLSKWSWLCSNNGADAAPWLTGHDERTFFDKLEWLIVQAPTTDVGERTPDEKARYDALSLLPAVCRERPEEQAKVLDWLAQVLQKDQDSAARRVAVKALVTASESDKKAFELLCWTAENDRDSGVRLAALREIRFKKFPERTACLERIAVHEPIVLNRKEAERALRIDNNK